MKFRFKHLNAIEVNVNRDYIGNLQDYADAQGLQYFIVDDDEYITFYFLSDGAFDKDFSRELKGLLDKFQESKKGAVQAPNFHL